MGSFSSDVFCRVGGKGVYHDSFWVGQDLTLWSLLAVGKPASSN